MVWSVWFERSAHGRKLDSLPLHHPPGSPLWKGVGHGTCNDSCNQNGELYSFTGLESPAIQGTFRGGKLCVQGCAIPHRGVLVESGKVLRRFYDTRVEIARFMESKQKVIPELEDESG